MTHLAWEESAYWAKSRPVATKPSPIYKSAAQIENELRNDPVNNAINESQLYHLLDRAIETARINGTLAEEQELING